MMTESRPRVLIGILSVAAIAGVMAAVFSFVGYQNQHLAQRDDVARNGALTMQLKRGLAAQEALQTVHRERNEEAHSCLLANQVEILNLLATLLHRPDLVRMLTEPTIVGTPCDGLVVGIPPPPPETTTISTTVKGHPTTTIKPKSKARTTTTTTRPSTTSGPPTTSAPPPPARTTTTLLPSIP